ncbi:hypothetical protein E8E14_007525 [Neopestalotiopsis sp. 37M]|nr:hypothetical protein E8E14_007525 [Neopestalotiopsis sp. 37M]
MDLQTYQHRFERLKEQAHSNKKDLFFYEAFKKSAQNIINHALNNGFPLVSIKWLIACILSMLSRGVFGPDIPQEERVTEFKPDTDDDTVDLEHLSATLKAAGANMPRDHLFWFLCTGGKQGTRPDQAPAGRGQPSSVNQTLNQQGRGQTSPSTSTHPPPQGSALSRSSDWADEVDEQFPLPPTGPAPNLGGGPAIPSAPKASEEFIWDTYKSSFGSVKSHSFPLPKSVLYHERIAPVAAQLSLKLGVKFMKTSNPHALTINLAEDKLGGFNTPARSLVAIENFYRALSFLGQWFEAINTKKDIPPLSNFIHDLRLSEAKARVETCRKNLQPIMARLGNKNYCQTFVPTVKTPLDPTDPYYSKRKTTEGQAAAQGPETASKPTNPSAAPQSTESVNKPSNPPAPPQNTQAATTTKTNPASTTSSASTESTGLERWKICHRKLWEGICLLDNYSLSFHNDYDLDNLDEVYIHHLRLLHAKKPTPGRAVLWALESKLTIKIEEGKFNKTHWKLGNQIINAMCKSLFNAAEDEAWQALEALNAEFAKDLAARDREEGWIGLFTESW